MKTEISLRKRLPVWWTASPQDIEKIYKDYAPEKSTASWVFRYIAFLDGVLMVLSGMSDESQKYNLPIE